jgi:LysR family transcriptional activator of nhaA
MPGLSSSAAAAQQQNDTTKLPGRTMEWLNYHHLRHFWTVAKDGSLARAAAKLPVSQPSISEQIRDLEAALGEKLFRRDGRNNVLTDAGQVVFGYAEDISPWAAN